MIALPRWFWVFLACFMLIGAIIYAIDRGLYVGTEIVLRDESTGQWWKRRCSYLLPSGIHHIYIGGHGTAEEAAEWGGCRMFLSD
jgi:hypothetical protein